MYYVYIITNPTVEQKVPVPELDIELTHQPIYVGKGSGNRWKAHFSASIEKENLPKWKFIKHLSLDYNMEDYTVVVPLETEDIAFEKEELLIKKFGRRKTNDGPLLNLLKGGRNESPNKRISGSKRKELWRKRVLNEDYIVILDYLTGEYIGEVPLPSDALELLSLPNTKKTQQHIRDNLRGYSKKGGKVYRSNHVKGYVFIRKKDFDLSKNYTRPNTSNTIPPISSVNTSTLFKWFCGSDNIFDVITRVCYTERSDITTVLNKFGNTYSGRVFERRVADFCKKYVYDRFKRVIPWEVINI